VESNGCIKANFLRKSKQWLNQDIVFSQESSKRNKGKETDELRTCKSAEEISFASSESLQQEGSGQRPKFLKR
jgi:hypothetical protein